MSATRLLILGALRFMQPAHGYAVREELETWHAEEWANIAYGSIYHALKKMSDEGLLRAVETGSVGNRPARTTYEVTEAGEQEFFRLLNEYWWEYKPLIDPFQVAFAFAPDVPPNDLLAALEKRRLTIQGMIDTYRIFLKEVPKDRPPHVAEIVRLTVVRLEAELTWIDDIAAKVERGELPGDNEKWVKEWIAGIQSGEIPLPKEEWSRRRLEELGIIPKAAVPSS